MQNVLVYSFLQEALSHSAEIKMLSLQGLYIYTDFYQESKQFKIVNSALEERGKIRDLTALAFCKQGMLGGSWCTGNSLEPLEALARAVGNLRAQQGDSSPRSQSICCQV